MTPDSKSRALRLARHHLPAVPGLDAEHRAWLHDLFEHAERLAAEPIVLTAGLDGGTLCFWTNGYRIGGPAKPLLLAWLILAADKGRPVRLAPADLYGGPRAHASALQARDRAAERVKPISPGLGSAIAAIGVVDGVFCVKEWCPHPVRCEMTDELAGLFNSVNSA